MVLDNAPKSILSKIVIVPESEWLLDSFREPTRFFIADALGNHVYFRTRSRKTAQEISDKLWGKGFFMVKQVVKAIVS